MAAHFPWLPIETAPRNEDVVLLVVGETGKTYPLLRPASFAMVSGLMRERAQSWKSGRSSGTVQTRFDQVGSEPLQGYNERDGATRRTSDRPNVTSREHA
jgi:hypothetical protein